MRAATYETCVSNVSEKAVPVTRNTDKTPTRESLEIEHKLTKKLDKCQINITYIKYACPEQKPAGVNDVQ